MAQRFKSAEDRASSAKSSAERREDHESGPFAVSHRRMKKAWSHRLTARWHEDCSENRRGNAKRDRKRQTPEGGRRLAAHSSP